jgi:hypothetical protein
MCTSASRSRLLHRLPKGHHAGLREYPAVSPAATLPGFQPAVAPPLQLP